MSLRMTLRDVPFLSLECVTMLSNTGKGDFADVINQGSGDGELILMTWVSPI